MGSPINILVNKSENSIEDRSVSGAPAAILARLRDLCGRLQRSDDLRSGIQAAAWACDGVFPFYRASIAFPARQPGRFYVAAAWARRPEEELSGYDFSLRGHPFERVVRTGATVVRADPSRDCDDAALLRLYAGEEKAEEMGVALELGSRRGLLVFSSREAGGFHESARAWAEDVGRVLSLWALPWAGPDAPEALREQYEALLEGSLDGIGVLQAGRLVYSNASLREIFGIPAGRAAPPVFESLLAPASREAFRTALRGLESRSRVLPRLEVLGLGGPEGHLHLDVGLQGILYEGEPAVLVQIHNASERAEREQQMRASYGQIDALVQTLAHDIRGPLTTIVGFSELLLQRELPPERVRESLQVLVQSSRRLRDLAEALLEFSSYQGSPELAADVATESILADVEIELQGLVTETGASITYRRIPPVVRGRRVELSRVFKNLLENAIKYARPGESPAAEVSCVDDGGAFCVFCVADNGIGIEPERREQVFRLFHRGQGGGAGVGLAIVERVVRGHGGRVWVEERQGPGSRIYFTLPKGGAAP